MGTRVLMPDGSEIPAVTRIAVCPIEAGGLVLAEITVLCELDEIEVHPLLSKASLQRAAAQYGLRLVPQGHDAVCPLSDGVIRYLEDQGDPETKK